MILHISQCMCRLCVICDSGNGSFWARENKPPGISGESRVRKITKAHVIISLKKKKVFSFRNPVYRRTVAALNYRVLKIAYPCARDTSRVVAVGACLKTRDFMLLGEFSRYQICSN